MASLEIHYELPLAIVIAGLVSTFLLRLVLGAARQRAAARTASLLREHRRGADRGGAEEAELGEGS